MQEFPHILTFISNTLKNQQFSGTQTDSFRVLRQSFYGKFKIVCGVWTPGTPAFSMYVQCMCKSCASFHLNKCQWKLLFVEFMTKPPLTDFFCPPLLLLCSQYWRALSQILCIPHFLACICVLGFACVCVIGFEHKTVLCHRFWAENIWLAVGKQELAATHTWHVCKIEAKNGKKGGRKKWQELQVGASYNTSGC